MAEGGWVGIAIPEEYGGGGRGITDAAVMLHEVAASGAAMNGCSALHLTDLRAQSRRQVRQRPAQGRRSSPRRRGRPPRRVRGDRARRRHRHRPHHHPRRARRQGRLADHRPQDLDDRRRSSPRWSCSSRAPATRTAACAASACSSPTSIPTTSTSARSRRSGATRSRRARSPTTACRSRAGASSATENEGFRLLLHGLNPERVLLASEACGIGEVALDRAITYAKERIVFDRPIGANQAISHPARARPHPTARPRG